MPRCISRYEAERRKKASEERARAAQPINDAIAIIKSELEPVVREYNERICAEVSKGRLELCVERLKGHAEDRLVIKGNLGDPQGSFTLATVVADLDGRLTIRFHFCEGTPMEVTAARLIQTVRRSAKDMGS